MTDIKKLPKSKIEFEVVVPWEKWGKYLDQAAAEISEELKIPGFRPGHAPKNMVEQKVGKEMILNKAANKAVEKNYVDFVMSEKLEVIGHPKVEILEMAEEKDLKFKVTTDIMPKIEVDGGYKAQLKKINEEYAKKDKTVKEEDINLELEKLANSRVKLITVNREARKNDSVEIDFTVLLEGSPIENGTSKNHPLIIGRGVFIPGFEENVIGMKEGEEKEFELTFPEKYHKKELAGKPAMFKVKMNLVQERQTPEIDDAFAKSLGDFADLVALKSSVEEGMRHEQEHKLADEKKNQFMEAIVKNSKTDLPEVLVHEEIHKMLGEFEYQTQAMGMSLDDYLKKIGKDKEELERDWEEQAQKRVISALALEEIAHLESVNIDTADVESEMNKTLQQYKSVKDMEKNIDMEKLYNYSKRVLENEKVFEMLEKL